MLDRVDLRLSSPRLPLSGPMQDDVGKCMQATGVQGVAENAVFYKDVAGKSVGIPLTPGEAEILRQKHGG